MKRIFMICPFAKPNIGGVESHLEKLLTALTRRGFSVLLVTYQPLTTKARGPARERRPGVEIVRLPWFGYGWFPVLEAYFPLQFLWLFPGLFFRSLVVYLRERRTLDVIHAHGLIAAAIAKTISTLHRGPIVVSTHAVYHFPRRRVLRALVRRILSPAHTIICVGSPSRDEIVRMGIPRERTRILRNWVDLDAFQPSDRAACRQALQIEGFTVLFVGRLLAKKGIPVLLEAARRLPDTKFVFLGDGPEAGTLATAARTLPNVSFRGRVTDEELVPYYTAADLFVQLALYDEGTAAVFLESIACGTPVIASHRGCARDYLDPEIAVLIEPTVEELTRVLSDLWVHPERLAALRARCRPYAERYYNEANVDVFLDSYGEERSRLRAVAVGEAVVG